MSSMSSEEKKAEGATLAGEGKALVVEVYKDSAARSVRAVGDFAGGFTELVLKIPNALVAGGHRLIDRVMAKLTGVPPERRALPPGPVAGPAILHYALLG